MRPALLHLPAVVLWTGVFACALAVAACTSEPSPAAGPAESDAHAAGSAFTIATDSLVLSDTLLRYTVAIGYPQLRGSAGEPLSATVRAVNVAIRDSVEALARDVRPVAPPAGLGAESPVDVAGGIGRSFVSDDVLSVLVSVTAVTGGSEGTVFFLPLTYDLHSGRALAPIDLFAPGAPWPETVARWTERGVLALIAKRRRTSPDSARADFFAQGLDTIREGQVALTMGRDSLRVHIQPRQLSLSDPRPFDIGVPYPAVRSIARPGSVLARRAAR